MLTKQQLLKQVKEFLEWKGDVYHVYNSRVSTKLKAIFEYCYELFNNIKSSRIEVFNSNADVVNAMLNGADSWLMYSFGGCSHYYNVDIYEALYLKPAPTNRVLNGNKLLERQAEYLKQASNLLIKNIYL